MMGRGQYCPQPWLHTGPVFDCQSSGEVTKMALFSIVKWPCFHLTKTSPTTSMSGSLLNRVWSPIRIKG
jgi:hypothetical protein